MSAPEAKASIAASTRFGICTQPPTSAPSTSALEPIAPNSNASPMAALYPPSTARQPVPTTTARAEVTGHATAPPTSRIVVLA